MAKRRKKASGRVVVSKSGRKYKKTASGKYVRVGRQLRVKAHLRKRRAAKKARPSSRRRRRPAVKRTRRRKAKVYTGRIRSDAQRSATRKMHAANRRRFKGTS